MLLLKINFQYLRLTTMNKQFLIALTLLITTSVHSQNWTSVGDGLNKGVTTLFTDTATNFLYAGGDFDSSGTLQLNHIGYWDGLQWNAIGHGFDDRVNGLTIYDGELYATGNFTYSDTIPLNYIAKWTGSTWVDVGGGLNNKGLAIFTLNDNLYVGGNFTSAGGQACKYIAKWDGTNWQSLDTNIVATSPSNKIMSIGAFQNELVIGGKFIAEGNATNIAILSGGIWQPLSTGANSYVTSIREYNNELIVTGFFNHIGSVNTICIAKWDGNSWFSFNPSPTSSQVNCSAIIGDNIVFGGYFHSFLNLNGSISSHAIASYNLNNQTWSGLTTGVSSSVNALETIGNTLYAGGSFDTAGLSPILNIAQFDASTLTVENTSSDNSIEIYPNPFIDKVFIKLNTSQLKKTHIQVFDVFGRQIAPTINYNSTVIEIDRGNLPSRLYFIKLLNDQQLIGQWKLIAL